jgi:surfeit locus 1 family protein
VEARAYGEPVNAPSAMEWSTIGDAGDYEYSRVRLSGTFINADEVQVYTVSDLGPGYWVMTPLKRDDGSVVIVNRGFVPTDKRDPATRAEGQVQGNTTVIGLMRAPETGGLFLRTNDPANGKWYSRDISKIAETARLSNVAPFYVDADATPNPGGMPIGGKTMLKFPNSHLSYAITWFILAAMTVAAGWYVVRNLNAPKRKHEDD